MTLEDLPDELGSRPLTSQPLVSAVLDLCVSQTSRATGAVYLLVCDAESRLVLPIAVDDVPSDPARRDCERLLSTFTALLAERDQDHSLLIAIARPGDPAPTETDLRWLTAAQAVCERAPVRLLGLHTVTPTGQHQLTA